MNGPSKCRPADLALLGELGEQPGPLGEEVHLAGDEGGDDGGRAVQPVGVDALEDLVDAAGGEGGAAAAVVVHVDEAGDEPVPGQVEGLGAFRGASDDAVAVDDHASVLDDPGGQHDVCAA